LRCSSIRDRYQLGADADYAALSNLVAGLESLASLELQFRSQEQMEQVHLRELLNDLRILIEGDWQDIDGSVKWNIPDRLPLVIAEPRGLVQAFLNLAQNSWRAVQESGRRVLEISVSVLDDRVAIRFSDSGPGVSDPTRLFQPFQRGAAGTGLGLYVSRVIVRSYGGDLRYEGRPAGSSFLIELDAVAQNPEARV
jgi:C4-dicarboxylate-specific signal transduction histidine kinase